MYEIILNENTKAKLFQIAKELYQIEEMKDEDFEIFIEKVQELTDTEILALSIKYNFEVEASGYKIEFLSNQRMEACVKRAFRVLSHPAVVDYIFNNYLDEILDPQLDSGVECYGLSKTTVNILISNNFKTLEDILTANISELITIPQMDSNHLHEIVNLAFKYKRLLNK